jgi:hypothetical protein
MEATNLHCVASAMPPCEQRGLPHDDLKTVFMRSYSAFKLIEMHRIHRESMAKLLQQYGSPGVTEHDMLAMIDTHIESEQQKLRHAVEALTRIGETCDARGCYRVCELAAKESRR